MNRSGAAPLCACGCGGHVVIRAKHRSMALPKYLLRPPPEPSPPRLRRAAPEGYKLVGEVAALFGVSATTLRRMEAEGVISKAKRFDLARGKSVRAFTAKEVERISRSRAHDRWRSRYPGRWQRG